MTSGDAETTWRAMTRPANPPPIMRKAMVETIPLIVLLALLTCAPNAPLQARAH